MVGTDRQLVGDYLGRVAHGSKHRRARGAATAPIEALQRVALDDPDPWVRSRCLEELDHVANEASTATFLAALDDPVADVRRHAVHGLTCERCRTPPVCVVDVVLAVIAAFHRERSPEIRHHLVSVLGRFASRSAPAREALAGIARDDPDELLREAAAAAAQGHVRSRQALQRLRRTAARRQARQRPSGTRAAGAGHR